MIMERMKMGVNVQTDNNTYLIHHTTTCSRNSIIKIAYKVYSLSQADLLGFVTSQDECIVVKSYVSDLITVVVVRDGLYCWVKSASR